MKAKVSVCIPAYNCAGIISETIRSILSQTFKDFELVFVDDVSRDNTVEVVRSFGDKRIKLCRNKKNLGCGGNLTACAQRARADIVFYICQDDILDKYALEKVYRAFCTSKEIGIVTRPYFWFDEDISRPIRLTRQFSKDQVVSLKSPYEKIRDVIALSDQISGIGFRKEYLKDFSFSSDYFLEMASVVLPVFKISKAYILKDNIVGVRVEYSGSRKPKVYGKSPMLAWYNLINKVYYEERFENLRKYLVSNFIANNYVGLVQIKNYGGMRYLIREIYYLLKLKWRNILCFKFWFYSLITLLVPDFLLKKITVFYKNEINSRLIQKEKYEQK